jgi:hypothetical protein
MIVQLSDEDYDEAMIRWFAVRVDQLDSLLVEAGIDNANRRRALCESYLWSLAGALFDEPIDIETTAGGTERLVAMPIQFERAALQAAFACDLRQCSAVAIHEHFDGKSSN